MLKICETCANSAWRDGKSAVTEVCLACTFGADKQPTNWKLKPMTNADRFHSATNDALKEEIHAISLGFKPWCDHHCANEGDDGCDNCIGEWLQQPADTHDNPDLLDEK